MNEVKLAQRVTELQEDEKILKKIEQNKTEAVALLNDKNKMDHFLDRLEDKLSDIPKVGKYLADIPVLASLVKDYVEKKYPDIPIGTIIAVIGALIYFINPFDIIPDVIPVVGYIDDAAVIALICKLVHSDVTEYKAWREANKKY